MDLQSDTSLKSGPSLSGTGEDFISSSVAVQRAPITTQIIATGPLN